MTNRTPLAGPNVWTGAEIKNSKRWIRDMPASAVAELDAALAHVKKKGLDWSQITRADFPLDGLDGLLADIADELENGVGIMKLRGFPVDRYDENDLRKIYFGLGTHLGTPVFQNRSGELMRAIRDEGAHVGRTYGETKDQKGTTFLSSYARTLTNGGLRFHTDRTDVVGLLCVRQARKGGVSTLASTPAIHNAILAKRPDLLDALFTDYWRSRFGEEGTGKDGSSTSRATAYPLPIFGVRDGKFTSHYSLTFIEAAQLAPDVPKLIGGAEGSDRHADGDGAGALLRDDARARRPAADQQPRHLPRPHAVRGRRLERPRPPAAPDLAHHGQQPAAAGRSRDPVAQHRGRPAARRHPAGRDLGVSR